MDQSMMNEANDVMNKMKHMRMMMESVPGTDKWRRKMDEMEKTMNEMMMEMKNM